MKRFFLAVYALLLVPLGAAEVYVAPDGLPGAEGTRELPLATVEEAVARLPQGGTVVLRGGIYRQTVKLESEADPAPITLRAEAGETVTFEGGSALTGWRAEEGGLYSALLPKDKGDVGPAQMQVWDHRNRVRFIRAMDEAGVRAWPGSFCVTQEGRVLLHPVSGAPDDESIGCNRLSRGLLLLRGKVTVEGLSFRNFFYNQYSAALVVGEVRDVTLADCRVENSAKAIYITPLADEVRILRGRFLDAGTAIAANGNRVTIEECVIIGPTGDYAQHDLLPVLRCGIRIYHPAVGAIVRGNVTMGYVHGLRMKTWGGKKGEVNPPFQIAHNSFTDGVSIVEETLRQMPKGSHFRANLIALDGEESTLAALLERYDIEAEGNHFYSSADRSPYFDLAAGDLRTHDLPSPKAGAEITKIELPASGDRPLLLSPKIDEHQSLNQRAGERPGVLHVKAGAGAAVADGSAAHPYPNLQAALDQVVPGDIVEIDAGVYTQPARLTTRGRPDAPITLRGKGAAETILDGGRRVSRLLSLEGTAHIRIEGICFRWFEESGLHLELSPDVSVYRCHFQNAESESRGATIGTGVFATRSPRLEISHSVTTRNRVGFKLVASPQAKIVQNTGFRNLNTALEMVRSCQGSQMTRNSFGYSSHASIYLWEPDPTALASITSDENNFANRLYNYRAYEGGKATAGVPLEVPPRYGHVAGGKAVVDVLESRLDDRPRVRYHELKAWQAAHGKDRHTLFADPGYANPLQGDFRLLSHSPNLLADGQYIGAYGPVSDSSR